MVERKSFDWDCLGIKSQWKFERLEIVWGLFKKLSLLKGEGGRGCSSSYYNSGEFLKQSQISSFLLF